MTIYDDGDEMTTAEALQSIARAIHRLGNADASTPFGGLEALGMVIKESNSEIAAALALVAEGLHDVADAIRETKE